MNTESKVATLLETISGYVKELKHGYANAIQDKTFSLIVDNLNDKVELLKFYLLGGDDVYGDGEDDGRDRFKEKQNVKKNIKHQDPIEQTILDLDALRKQIQNER